MPTLRTGTFNKGMRLSDRQGFTLLEIAVVVLIISLMSLLVVPLLGRAGNSDLKSAGRKLAGTVKYLYNEAALQGQVHRMTFDLDENNIALFRQETNSEWTALPGRRAQSSLPGSVNLKLVEVVGKGMFTSGQTSMDVFPVGWLEQSILHLEDGSAKMTVRFSPLTGTAEFFEGHREFR